MGNLLRVPTLGVMVTSHSYIHNGLRHQNFAQFQRLERPAETVAHAEKNGSVVNINYKRPAKCLTGGGINLTIS